MANYSTEVSSPWTAEEAFDYIADFRNLTEWDPGVSESEIISGDEPGVGTVYSVTANGATLDYVTQTHDRPTKFVVEGASKRFYSYDVIEFTATETGCVVGYNAKLELRGALGIATPALGPMFKKIGDEAAAGLAKALDGEILS